MDLLQRIKQNATLVQPMEVIKSGHGPYIEPVVLTMCVR